MGRFSHKDSGRIDMTIEKRPGQCVNTVIPGLTTQGVAMADSNPRTSASVYRYYDRNGILIYVGVTSRGLRRQEEHSRKKEWWPYVDHQSVEHFATRKLALQRERELIESLAPPYNVQHNPLQFTEYSREAMNAIAGDIPDAPGRWIPLAVVCRTDKYVDLVTDSRYAKTVCGVFPSVPTNVIAPGCRVRMNDLMVRKAGGAIAVRVFVSHPDLVEYGAMKYRQPTNGPRSIKVIELKTPASKNLIWSDVPDPRRSEHADGA